MYACVLFLLDEMDVSSCPFCDEEKEVRWIGLSVNTCHSKASNRMVARIVFRRTRMGESSQLFVMKIGNASSR